MKPKSLESMKFSGNVSTLSVHDLMVFFFGVVFFGLCVPFFPFLHCFRFFFLVHVFELPSFWCSCSFLPVGAFFYRIYGFSCVLYL